MSSASNKPEEELTADFLEVADSSASSRKVRKPQSEEEFEKQKQQFLESGPVVQTNDWLLKIKELDPNSKVDRGYLKNAAERAYYLKDYNKALELVDQTKEWSLGNNDIKEFDIIRKHCLDKLALKRADKIDD